MKVLLTIFLFLSFAHGPARATSHEVTEKPIIRVGFALFPGFSELNEKGEVVGKTVQLTRDLLDHAGYQADFRIMPIARIVSDLQSGRVHLSPGILNKPGLAGHTLVTERNLGKAVVNLYHRPDEVPPVLPEGLSGKRLVLITNFTYLEMLVEELQDSAFELDYVTSTSHLGAVRMLLKGRGDYLLDYPTPVSQAARQLGIEPLPWVRFSEQPIRFFVSLRSGYAQQLKEDLDRAYDELVVQGADMDLTGH